MAKEQEELLEEETEEIKDAVEDEEQKEPTEEEEVEETTKTETPKAKVSSAFFDTIKAYLDNYASQDSAFNERYNNPDKNINDCCNYILNQVQKSGCNGFADEEIYKMARDYYVDDISKDDCKAVSGSVVVNHQVELTEEEKEKARIEAIKRFEEECLQEERRKRDAEAKAQAKAEAKEQEKIRKAEEKKKLEEEKKAQEIEKAKANGGGEQMSLFDI